jgi:hypothetical protein
MHPMSAMMGRKKYKTEILVTRSSSLESEIIIPLLRAHKWPGTAQIPAEVIEGGEMLFSEIHKPSKSISNKEDSLISGGVYCSIDLQKVIKQNLIIIIEVSLLSTSRRTSNSIDFCFMSLFTCNYRG